MATDGRAGVARGPAEIRRHGMSRRQAWVTAAMAVLILIPSMYGFVGKFVEFVHIYRGAGGGEFAVAPILNYLLASAGFFCMLLWAAWNGMFRDIEKPKVDFLDNEALLDRDARVPMFRREPSAHR